MRWVIRHVVVMTLVLAWGLLFTAPTARADTGAFLDEAPLIIGLDGRDQRVVVEVVNALPGEGVFKLLVAGDTAEHVTVNPTSQSLPPGPSNFVVLVSSSAKPSQGSLLLLGPGGLVVRRAIRLQPAQGPIPAEAFIVGSAGTLTKHMVSGIPSYVRPVPPPTWGARALLVFLVCAAVAIFWWRKVRQGDRRVLTAVFASVALVAAAACLAASSVVIAALFNQVHAEQAVKPVPLPIYPPVQEIRLVSLPGNNGDIGQLSGDSGALQITGLDAAGTYSGAITIGADQPGAVNIVVNVRDWWVFAATTVGLGVALGWLIHVWYGQFRNRQQVLVAAAQLRRLAAKNESTWQLSTIGQPVGAAYALIDPLLQVIGGIEKTAADDPVAALKKLSALEGIVLRFEAVRDRARDLASVRRKLESQESGVPLDLVKAARKRWAGPWKRVVSHRLAISTAELQKAAQDPQAETIVDERERLVEEAATLATASLESAERLRVLGRQIVHKDANDGLQSKWKSLAVDVLSANSTEEIEKVETELDKVEDELSALLESVVPEEHAGSPQQMLIRRYVDASLPSASSVPRVSSPSEPAITTVSAHDRDDLITVAAPAAATPTSGPYRWRFSDDDLTELFELPQNTQAVVQHVFGGDSRTATATLETASGTPIYTAPYVFSVRGHADRTKGALSIDDRLMALLVTAVAVGSGIVTLYVPNRAWGSLGDYLTALLWGAATAEALKAAAQFLTSRQNT